MKNVYLAGSVRTPIGRFGGTLSSWTAADLGVAAAKESLQRARIPPIRFSNRFGVVRAKLEAGQTSRARLLIAPGCLRHRRHSRSIKHVDPV